MSLTVWFGVSEHTAQAFDHTLSLSLFLCSIESNWHHFYLDYEELSMMDVWKGRVGGDSELVSVWCSMQQFWFHNPKIGRCLSQVPVLLVCVMCM